jgi:hypothetical protein
MVIHDSKHLAQPPWQGGWAVAIFISDNLAAAEVCLVSSLSELALNVIFAWQPVGQVPDLPRLESERP